MLSAPPDFRSSFTAQEQRGIMGAVNSLVWRLPNSFSTIAGGIILSSGDCGLPIFLATAFYAVSITLLYFVFKDVKPSG